VRRRSGVGYNRAVLTLWIKIRCTLSYKLGGKIQRLIAHAHVKALARGFTTLEPLVRLYRDVRITAALAIVVAFSLLVYLTGGGQSGHGL
jgi:hypothetical protein